MNDLDKAALDRHITGNWGGEYSANPMLCPKCHGEEFVGHGRTECEWECECGEIFHEDDALSNADMDEMAFDRAMELKHDHY